MEFINEGKIKIDRVMNGLDKFVFDFIRVLEMHTDYVIISGYVSILLGRSRATEDVDVFIKEMSKDKFVVFYKDLEKKGYWCLNGDDIGELYGYLEDGLAIRFAENKKTVPNFEIKFAKKRLDLEAFQDFIIVETSLGEIKISSLERQIAFKRYYLKSDKDLEDAKHIEETFKKDIDVEKIGEYRKIIENEMA